MSKPRIGVALGLLALALGSTSPAQAAPPTNREPYDVAIRCVIANVVAEGQRRRAGDPIKADYYAAKGKEAFGVAHGLGEVLKFSRVQIDADFDRARKDELPAMIRDQPYFHRVVAQCKAYGLM